MSSQVPSITVLRERATQLLGRGCVRGQLKAMMAGAFAAKNAGTPLDPESTSQELVTQCQGLINQADQDVLAILVRELLEFVENGGGGGGDAPAVIAPFPGIGAEGEYYAQQIRTTGATPQTFTVTSEELPPGLNIDTGSGIISGTCLDRSGGLYAGVITVTNTAGTTDYQFSILVTGEAVTFTPTWNYPIALLGSGFAGDAGFGSTYTGNFSVHTTSNDLESGSLPITWTFYSAQSKQLPDGITFDSDTGQIIGTATNPEDNSRLFQFSITATNYFGFHTENYSLVVVPTVYYGEWHGSLPVSFTAADIQSGLFNGSDAGPRITPSGGFGPVAAQAANILYSGYFSFPATSPARARVFAVPTTFFTGTYNQGNSFTPSVGFSPTWPTPYQTGLVLDVNGISVEYDIYVVPATTGAFLLYFTANQAPQVTTTGSTTRYIVYAGDPEFRPNGIEDQATPTLQLTVVSALPVTYTTEGSLPTGLTWDDTTQRITGSATNPDDVFERFPFTIISTNANGSTRTELIIYVSAPIYFGELPGSLPGAFVDSDITSGLLTNGSAGPLEFPSVRFPGTYSTSTPAIGFLGGYLPSTVGWANNAQAYNPGIFYFYPIPPVLYFSNPAPPMRVIAVPAGFFTGSWAQDAENQGTTLDYYPHVAGGVPAPVFNPPLSPGQSMNTLTPYQSGLVITTNGVAVLYDIYVCTPVWNIYGYAGALYFGLS